MARNLTAAFEFVSSTTIATGGSTVIDCWLVNFGSAAPASTTGIYLSTDTTITTSDRLVTTVTSPALTIHGTPGYYDRQTVTLNLPGDLAPGTYYIGGIADYTNGITESDEANNNHEVTRISAA
jgi:hypothetical protein